MDYEKAYKEALERAKRFHTPDSNNSNLKAVLELIFPELAESEDEIHRKWILKYFCDGLRKANEQFKDYFTAAITDLEKRKEQKPDIEICPHSIKGKSYSEQKPAECITDAEMKRSMDSLLDFKVFAANLAKQFNITHKRDIDWHNFCAGLLTYLEGNKPTEWNETDNIGWDEAFACVTRAEKAAKNEEELQNAVTAEKWLKEIKFKYYVHSSKQEWSEEDEGYLIRVIDAIEQEYTYSEADELKDWVKSLRPKSHWKPSEEQMDALWNTLHPDDPYYVDLSSLYNDLKKL